ncbi:MAG: hypothetical protein IE925_10080 [Rhodobacterales bacterium]|nr:hypothetical protein [Rhodobacterales bacterium]
MNATTAETLADLAASLQEGLPLDVACFRINDAMEGLGLLGQPGLRIYPEKATYEQVEKLIRAALPGWGWRTAQSSASTSPLLFPCYEDPKHGARLERQYPPERWHRRQDVHLNIHPPIDSAAALCAALLVTLATILQDRQAAEARAHV